MRHFIIHYAILRHGQIGVNLVLYDSDDFPSQKEITRFIEGQPGSIKGSTVCTGICEAIADDLANYLS